MVSRTKLKEIIPFPFGDTIPYLCVLSVFVGKSKFCIIYHHHVYVLGR
jgi:hypothetical protein